MVPSASDRSYAGVPMHERRSERRRRIVAAGLDLLGTQGYDATTVRQVCDAAQLTERYFYEHFAGRPALLEAVYEHVVEQVAAATLQAIAEAPADLDARARAGLDAFLGALESDSRLARVQLLEVVGRSDELERRRRAVLHAYADMLAGAAEELAPRDDMTGPERRIAALGLVGATNEIAIDWVLGDLQASRATLVDQLVRMYVGVARG